MLKDRGCKKQRNRLRSNRTPRGVEAYFGFCMFGGAFLTVLVAPAKETRHAVHSGEGGGRWEVACSGGGLNGLRDRSWGRQRTRRAEEGVDEAAQPSNGR